MDFVYERFKTPKGIKVEIVTGGNRYKGKVWTEIAKQIYCENGKDGYRELGHFAGGAPFLYNEEERISISHTEGCLAVATIKAPADSNLSEFNPALALGIDVERADREKVLKLRDRFLTEGELNLIPADSLEANIIAWTCKEAMLKAGMDPAIDWHNNIIITTLPTLKSEGKGYIILKGYGIDFSLYTIKIEEYLITIAWCE